MKQAIEDKTEQYYKENGSDPKQATNSNEFELQQEKRLDDDDDDFDEDEREILEKMKKERLGAFSDVLQENKKKGSDNKEHLWYGEYTEIVESEFLSYVTKAKFSIVHFYHNDFERCKIIDMHLAKIAPEHKECKFMKLDAEKSPFFVQKLAIRLLPTICCFKDGVLQDQVIGFEELGAKDDFKTIDLVRR